MSSHVHVCFKKRCKCNVYYVHTVYWLCVDVKPLYQLTLLLIVHVLDYVLCSRDAYVRMISVYNLFHVDRLYCHCTELPFYCCPVNMQNTHMFIRPNMLIVIKLCRRETLHGMLYISSHILSISHYRDIMCVHCN